MAKIDFLKVEKELSKAVHTMFVKNVVSQKATLSQGLVDFFRLDDGPRPKPIDPVEQGLQDLVKESKTEQNHDTLLKEKEDRKKELLSQGKTAQEVNQIIQEEINEEILLEKELSFSKEPPESSISPPEKIPTKESEEKPIPPITVLRKHILWMRRKKIADVYENIGTTKEEFSTLKLKKVLSPLEEKKVLELLKNAEKFKNEYLQKMGLEDDDTIIAQQRKKHVNKRFNVKETWLPLQ